MKYHHQKTGKRISACRTELCEELRLYISLGTAPNYLAFSVEKKVAVMLYYLKDTGTIWMTANTFGIHQCTVYRIVLQVYSAVSTHLCPKYIHLSRTEDEMRVKVSSRQNSGWYRRWGALMEPMFPSDDQKLIRKIVLITKNYSRSVFKQYVMLRVCSWMSNAGGLAVCGVESDECISILIRRYSLAFFIYLYFKEFIHLFVFYDS